MVGWLLQSPLYTEADMLSNLSIKRSEKVKQSEILKPESVKPPYAVVY